MKPFRVVRRAAETGLSSPGLPEPSCCWPTTGPPLTGLHSGLRFPEHLCRSSRGPGSRKTVGAPHALPSLLELMSSGALPAGSPCKQDSCDQIWLAGAARSQDSGQALPRPPAPLSEEAKDGGGSKCCLALHTDWSPLSHSQPPVNTGLSVQADVPRGSSKLRSF